MIRLKKILINFVVKKNIQKIATNFLTKYFV